MTSTPPSNSSVRPVGWAAWTLVALGLFHEQLRRDVLGKRVGAEDGYGGWVLVVSHVPVGSLGKGAS